MSNSRRKLAGGHGRELFASHGGGNQRGSQAGKGSAPRYRHDANWISNYAEIVFPGVTGLVRAGAKLVKQYGAAQPDVLP